MIVAGVLCLVDREQGGRLNIERALAEIPPTNAFADDALTDPDDDLAIPFISVFTASDVRRAHLALK